MKNLKDEYEDLTDKIALKDLEIKKLKRKKLTTYFNTNKKFRQENKWAFIGLGALLIMCLIFNIGAFMITNTMVSTNLNIKAVQENKPIKYVETNPAPAKEYGWESAGFNYTQFLIHFLTSFFLHFKAVIIIAFFFLYSFFIIKDEKMLYWFYALTIMLTLMSSYDFFHDLQLLLAHKVVFSCLI